MILPVSIRTNALEQVARAGYLLDQIRRPRVELSERIDKHAAGNITCITVLG